MIMRPDRRTFLRMLLATPIAMELDVEKLLWVPRPMITVPALPLSRMGLLIDDINRVTYQQIMPVVHDLYFGSTPFLAYMRDLGWSTKGCGVVGPVHELTRGES
jgi:hypothetical protein